MRIGFLTQLYMPDTGGAEILLDRLIRALAQRGHHVALVAPRRRGAAALPYPVVRTWPPFTKKFLLLHHALPCLAVAHARHRFDVLHCQGEYHAPCVARTFRRLTGLPYVVRPVGGGFATVAGRPRLWARTARALESASAIVAQGEFLREQILAFGDLAARVQIIRNGVDAREIRIDGDRPRAAPYILHVGGLRREKGWDVLVRAFALIAADVPAVQLVIAGSDREREAFEVLARELGLAPPRLAFVGNLDRRAVALHYRHAAVYVCPSRREAFSNANIEALAAGVPVIATAVGGNTEQIRPGRDGLLVPPDDPPALAVALKQVLTDRALAEQLAAGALARSREFDWDAMVDAYEALYARVAGVPAGGAEA